jgi:hypothetical protein
MSAGIAVPALPARRVLRATALTALATGASGAVLGRAVVGVLGDPKAPWMLGRAAGLTAYALLVVLVCTGLLLAHPAAARFRRPHPAVRLRLHAGLAAFTFAFLVLHVVVLATDRYARVGWSGSIVPFASGYRPLPVTLGVLAAYSGLLAGATAALAGRLGKRLWWPIHRVSGLCFVLVWFHGVLTGSDTTALRALYAGSGVLVVTLALARHLARPALVRA